MSSLVWRKFSAGGGRERRAVCGDPLHVPHVHRLLHLAGGIARPSRILCCLPLLSHHGRQKTIIIILGIYLSIFWFFVLPYLVVFFKVPLSFQRSRMALLSVLKKSIHIKSQFFTKMFHLDWDNFICLMLNRRCWIRVKKFGSGTARII